MHSSPITSHRANDVEFIPCDDLIGPGWVKYQIPRKDGSGRVDNYFLSPSLPGRDKVKKRSLSSARKYHNDVIMSMPSQPLENDKRNETKMESLHPEGVVNNNDHAVDTTRNDDYDYDDATSFHGGDIKKSPSLAGKSRDIDHDEEQEDEEDDLQLNLRKSNSRSRSIFLDDDEKSEGSEGEDLLLDDIHSHNNASDSDGSINSKSNNDNNLLDEDDSSVESVVLYNYHPAKEPSKSAYENNYNRLCHEFFLENGLLELSTEGPLGIIECLVSIFAVTEPDSNEFNSVKKLIKFLRKKRATRSGTLLTPLQELDLHDLISSYVSCKQLSQRPARWCVSNLCAISKLVNRAFMVLSPAEQGESVVRMLNISPRARRDFSFEQGPFYFPQSDLDIESDSKCMPFKSLSANSASADVVIVRACIDFDTNEVTGFIPFLPGPVDNDHGLVDTDDEDEVSSNFKTASSSILPAKRTAGGIDSLGLFTSNQGDAFETPNQKKRIANASHFSLPPVKIGLNPYKNSNSSSQKSEPQKQMQEIQNDEGGWGSSPLVLASLKKKKPLSSNRNNDNLNVVFELTHGITDLKTGEKVHLGQFSSHGNLLWYFKADALNPSFSLWFQVKGPKAIDGPPAACYSTWHDTFIRRTHHGENKYQRRGRIIAGRAPYPVNRPCCSFRINPSGFPVEVLANKFESTFRSMCSDGRVLAEYLFSHLEENATPMLNSFLEGKFRRGDDRNSPYEDSGQLKDMFRRDIEDTFKNGFTRFEFKNHFDKHYCDHTIKEFLISLGYNSFEELKEDERPLIYKSGRFPKWDDIQEEPISVSFSDSYSNK